MYNLKRGGFMYEIQIEHLKRTIESTLQQGGTITVYGWLNSNHNEVTRFYESMGRIAFIERREKLLNVNGELVLFTRFISHRDQKKLKMKAKSLYPHPVHIGILRNALAECRHLFRPVDIDEIPENGYGKWRWLWTDLLRRLTLRG